MESKIVPKLVQDTWKIPGLRSQPSDIRATDDGFPLLNYARKNSAFISRTL